jgi:E3 SUMO-protein ligase NSE2
MSHRRLLNRSQINSSSSSSSQRRRPADVDAGGSDDLELPPYEPPSCVLSAKARADLNRLRDDDDGMTRYRAQIEYSKKIIPKAVAQINDKAQRRKEINAKAIAKRRKEGRTDHGRTDGEVAAERFATQLEEDTKEITQKSEKALRDMIDFDDERSMYSHIVNGVVQGISVIPAPALDDIEDEVENIPSAVELLGKSRKDYLTNYQTKSMLQKYVLSSSVVAT